MTVSTSSVAPDSYTANGSQATFAFDFPSISISEVEVYLDGVLQSSGFNVEDYSSSTGGNIHFVDGSLEDDPPASGVVVKIQRKTDITQARSYTYPATTHEAALDKITHILQELEYRISQLE